MNTNPKITASHLSRTAVVYLRQSSAAQVRDHGESTSRQYALADQAAAMGWPRRDIEVIDADLGLSGRTIEHHRGLRELMARVGLGEIGAIFVLEVSRLARSSADFQRLLDFARLADALLVDPDGVYDLRDFNDRLLGLKGTMSEVELHLMAGRLRGGQESAAARGALRKQLPIGYLYDPDGQVVIDPDAEVQTAVADVFACFAAAGSAHGVLKAFRGRRFPARITSGPDAGQLRWGRLTHSRVLRMLANPTYAGAYAYGRRTETPRPGPNGTITRAVTSRRRDQWPVLILDHHPGYISWGDYLACQDKIAANYTAGGARPVREGSALCQGVIFCGSCGRPMWTRYHHGVGPGGAYQCTSANDQRQTPTCRSIAAPTIDDAVAALLLQALDPAEVTVVLAAADEIANRHARATKAAELAVERARYDADRAARAYHACEPENRLVARTLEARWEARLTTLDQADKDLAATRAAATPLPPAAELAALVGDVHTLWHAETTTTRDRKRLLRTLIADVTILPEADPWIVRVGVRWHSGATETLTLRRPQAPRTPQAALDLIRRLGPTTDNQTLVDLLNEQGQRTAHSDRFTPNTVQCIRYDHHIAPATPPPSPPGRLTVTELADTLGIRPATVYDWIRHDVVKTDRSSRHILILCDPETEESLRVRVANQPRIKHTNPTSTTRRAV